MSRKTPFLALCALALAAPLVADRFPALIETYKHPALAAEVSPVSGVTFSIAHMKLDLASGNAAYITAGGERIGLFFRGNGTLRYETTEATELPIVSHKVKKAPDLKYQGDAARGVIIGSFDELLLLASNVTLPELSGSGGGSLAQAFAEHRERLARNRVVPVSHALVLNKLALGSKKFVQAEIAGDGDDLVYRYDEGENADEDLLKLRSLRDVPDSTIKRWLVPVTVSSQPIGRDHRAVRPSPYRLTAIDFTLIGDGDDAKLTVTETIKRERGRMRFASG